MDSQNNIVVAGPYYMETSYKDFFMKLDLSGNLQGATKISNTANGIFSNVYTTLGKDLIERPGNGYAYSTFFKNGFNHQHCLLTTDYAGTPGCASLGEIILFPSSR